MARVCEWLSSRALAAGVLLATLLVDLGPVRIGVGACGPGDRVCSDLNLITNGGMDVPNLIQGPSIGMLSMCSRCVFSRLALMCRHSFRQWQMRSL